MKTTMKHVAVVAALVALWLSGVQAHHGLANFDTTKSATIEGTVTTWEWANPHVYLYVDVASPQGVANWRIEFGSVGNLRLRGMSRTTFKAGDKVRAGQVLMRLDARAPEKVSLRCPILQARLSPSTHCRRAP